MTLREAELTHQLEAALAAVATLQAENALLRQKVDRLVQRVFGSTSERLSPGQLELLLALPATSPVVVNEPPAPVPATVRSRKERAPLLPETFRSSKRCWCLTWCRPRRNNGGASGRKSANSSTTSRVASCAAG
jgi:hypothetical protein